MGYNSAFLPSTPLNVNTTSKPQQLVDGQLYSIQAAFSGSTCTFSMKLQVSSDVYSNDLNYIPLNWDDLLDSDQSIAAAGTFTYNVSQAGYQYVRLVITDGSGGTNNGNISANINVKD